jgi:2-oxoglutarate ferredoxin oxidoreductase subunit beta
LHLVDDSELEFSRSDYEAGVARWCPGCGDHSVLSAMQRLLADHNLKPEETVFVSGIGCSSRFPHYMKTYGFHGIHGRALPIATGVKLHRPELNVFVVMGDGDCISIGAGHWVHAMRYNVNMTALLLDNHIYGMTKKQTSPTTPEGYASNTQPHGSYLPAINPIVASLGIANASFVAQTAEWIPPHQQAVLEAAFEHPGFSFVRILQRCPHFTDDMFTEEVQHPDAVQMLVHPDGVEVPELAKRWSDRLQHDPSNLQEARRLAGEPGKERLGVFYRNDNLRTYENRRHVAAHTVEEKMEILNEELDRYAV